MRVNHTLYVLWSDYPSLFLSENRWMAFVGVDVTVSLRFDEVFCQQLTNAFKRPCPR